MIPGFDSQSLNNLATVISELERFNLEGATPEEFDPSELFDESEQAFFRIRGLEDYWRHQSEADFKYHTIDMVISTHNQRQADLAMVLLGTPQKF